MSTQYVIDIDNHVVRTTFSGRVTCRNIVEYASKLRGDPGFAPHFSELVMFGEDPDIQLSYLDWQSLSTTDPFLRSSKRAFVVQHRSAVLGAIRMHQTARSDAPNIRIFETEDEALSWLSEPERRAQAEGL